MVTTPTDDDDDEDTLKHFTRILGKVLPNWLATEGKDLVSSALKLPTQASDSLTDFMRSALEETKAERKALADQLEQIREILTPEQLTLLKSLKSAGKGDPSSPPKKDGTEPPPAPPPGPPPEKKRKWL